MVEPLAAVAVVRDVPAEPVELRPFTGRRRLEQLVVRHVGDLERSAMDDLRAFDGAVAELQPDELQHVVDGRAESAGRRLGVGVRASRGSHTLSAAGPIRMWSVARFSRAT